MSLPAGVSSLSAMLIVPDTAAAIAWYRDALGAGVLWDLGGVAGMQIDGAPFFPHEAVPNRTCESSPGGGRDDDPYRGPHRRS